MISTSSSSCSFTDRKPDQKFEHTWSIANFDTILNMKNCEKLQSRTIICRSESCTLTDSYLEMHPHGYETKQRVSLFFKLGSVTPKPAEVEVFFYVVENGEKKRGQSVKHSYEKFKSKVYSTSTFRELGALNLIGHSEILLPADKTFTVSCEILIRGVFVAMSSSMKSSEIIWKGPVNNQLSLDMTTMFESGDFSDCIVECGARKFNCHKNILGSRSSVFKAMFTHDMTENRSGKLEITDLDEETLYEMILYIYSGNVRYLDSKASNLLSAAEKYALTELKQICEEYLCENVDMENVCDLLLLSNLYNCSRLRKIGLEYVAENREDLVFEKEWKTKLQSDPEMMASIIEILCS